jgi:hypothetical protein
LELDILVQTEYGVIGLEVKGRKKIINSDIKAMKQIAHALGKEWRGGIVLYQGDEIKKLSEPAIWSVPSRRLFT